MEREVLQMVNTGYARLIRTTKKMTYLSELTLFSVKIKLKFCNCFELLLQISYTFDLMVDLFLWIVVTLDLNCN